MKNASQHFALIKRFSVIRRTMRLDAYATDLFYALLAEAHAAGWAAEFTFSKARLMEFTGMSAERYYKSLHQLAKADIIVYRPRPRCGSTISFVLDETSCDAVNEPAKTSCATVSSKAETYGDAANDTSYIDKTMVLSCENSSVERDTTTHDDDCQTHALADEPKRKSGDSCKRESADESKREPAATLAECFRRFREPASERLRRNFAANTPGIQTSERLDVMVNAIEAEWMLRDKHHADYQDFVGDLTRFLRYRARQAMTSGRPLGELMDRKRRFFEQIGELMRGEDAPVMSRDRLNGFFDYWTETDCHGSMRFERERFWNTDKRLQRWATAQ